LLRIALPWSQRVLRDRRETRTVRTRHGFQLSVELDDWLGRHVYVTGEYEPGTSRVIGDLLRPGDTVIDVGANIGYFTLLASRRIGASGTVFAFEPLPRTRDGLERNLQLNGVSNVLVRAEAASNVAGEATFYEGPPTHRGTSSLRPLENASRRIRIRTDRLDDVLPEDCRINLVKIDVEGAEYQVLEGMDARIRRDRPDLVVEVTDEYLRVTGASAEQLCRWLFERGYRMFVIDNEGLVPVEGYTAALPRQFNALFSSRPELPSPLRKGR
jgi:FkbM family methyltransferase